MKKNALFLFVILLTACASATQPPVSYNAGDTIISPVDGATLVYIPAGEFTMGTDQGMTDEAPAHAVYLDSFWLDQTEVTNEAYRKCVEAGACKPPFKSRQAYDDPAYAAHPVVYVSWNDSVNYCTFSGRRLPTEAEWEKAATWNPRTNEKYIFPWGNEYDCAKGNFDDETEQDASVMAKDVVNCDGFKRSAPAGSFPQGASPYGILDMGGNVWEWVHDTFIEVDPLSGTIRNYYYDSPYKNPQGVDPALSEYRVMRGGSWDWTFGVGRSTYRLWFGLDDAYEGVGFRCAMNANP
ncbi:MAG: Serine/threonine-protein kinase pkn1 [Anaerolineales bacterium]|nr:Serine/threonine-protein kinase pkn1 [Anaerolineales bacterium]